MEREDNDIILSELKKFSTFQNPNCFDDYYMKVLPSLPNVNYIYVSKHPILNIKIPKSQSSYHKTQNYAKKTVSLSAKNSNTNSYFLNKKRKGRELHISEETNENFTDKLIEKTIKAESNNHKQSGSKNNNSPQKDNALIKCLICGWEFPEEMTVKEKSIHLNYCLEGKGETHKKSYLESKIVSKFNHMPLEEKDYQSCPICSKLFKIKNIKIKMNHIADCMKEFQEFDLYSSKRKRGVSSCQMFLD